MDVEIAYSDTTFEMSLVLDGSGAARLTIGTNRTDSNYGILGVFRGFVSVPDVQQLAAAMRSADFRSAADPDSAVSGEPVQQLRLKDGQQEIMKWSTYSHPPAPPVADVEQRVLTLIHELRRQPELAVSVSAPDFPAKLERGKPVKATICIHNPGTATLKLQNPQDWSRDIANLRLIALRSDIPLEALAGHHQVLEDLYAENVVEIKGGQIKAHFIALPPGQTVLYTLAFTPDWPPGTYGVEILFSAGLYNTDEEEQLHCTYITRPASVTVHGKPKPGDDPDDEIVEQ